MKGGLTSQTLNDNQPRLANEAGDDEDDPPGKNTDIEEPRAVVRRKQPNRQ